MVFQNVRGKTLHGIFNRGQLDQNVVAICVLLDHFGDTLYLSAYSVESADDQLFLFVASFRFFVTAIRIHIQPPVTIIYPLPVYCQ